MLKHFDKYVEIKWNWINLMQLYLLKTGLKQDDDPAPILFTLVMTFISKLIGTNLVKQKYLYWNSIMIVTFT